LLRYAKNENFQMATTDITRHDHDKVFDKPTDASHKFKVTDKRVHVLEMADAHFNHDSATLMPDHAAEHLGDGSPLGDKLTALAVLKAAYLHARANPSWKLHVVGHTDTSGPADYNMVLSKQRADNVVSMLLGEREKWIQQATAKHKTEDIKQYLKFAADNKKFSCDPGPIDNVDNAALHDATREFQKAYNVEFGPQGDAKIGADGTVGHDTWGAFFDVAMDILAKMMSTNRPGLVSFRSSIKFLRPRKCDGCGENFPIDEPRRDSFKSVSNRRVELMFFEPGEEPTVDCHPSAGVCLKDKCEINNRKFYRIIPLPAAPTPVVVLLTITSPGIDDARRVSHGAAVAVNDDTDNGLNFGPAPGGGHRELEPIFDLDHFEDTPKEDDLLPIKIDLKPNTVSGDVELKRTAGAADLIRIWPKKTKGKKAEVIALPAKFPAGTLPKELFIEGLKPGQVTLEVSFAAPTGPVTDKLVVNVVELVETQGGTRKILYDYNSAIQFKVNGAPANYTFEWDLDGDGAFNTATAEVGKTTDTVTVKYGPAAAADTVQLDQTVANIRKAFPVKAKMTGGLVLQVKGRTIAAGGAETLGIRVALNTNQGTALPAVGSNAAIQALIAWSDNFPVVFSAATAAEVASHQALDGTTNPFTGVNRIQFGPTVAGANAVTPRPGTGNGRRVYGVVIGPGIFTSGQVQSDLIATVNHEIKHLQQHVSVRDNAPASNVWRLLDNNFGGANGYQDLREAEGHFSELLDTNVSWRHQLPAVQSDLILFTGRYNASLGVIGTLPNGATKVAARTLVQGMYRDIPWFEMKRPGYDQSVRAPI